MAQPEHTPLSRCVTLLSRYWSFCQDWPFCQASGLLAVGFEPATWSSEVDKCDERARAGSNLRLPERPEGVLLVKPLCIVRPTGRPSRSVTRSGGGG